MCRSLQGSWWLVICLVFIKETPVFLKQRIAALKTALGEETNEDEKTAAPKGKTGVFHAIKFIATHKQLRWIAISAFIFACSVSVTGYYEAIMTTGGMETAEVTQALFIFPLMSALFTLIGGFLSDVSQEKSLYQFWQSSVW